jgi:hypothetical protein
MLVVILFRFGIKFATPAINLVAALLVSGTFQYRVLWTVQCKKQKLIMKMQSKSREKLNKFTKKLMRSVEIKKVHRTEGQDCEGRVDRLEHLEKSVDFVEVGCVPTVDSEKALEVIDNVAEDENVDETKAQSKQLPASVRKPSLRHLWVNLVGKGARDHPGQSQKYLWEEHNTVKVDQQGQIISRMRADKVIDSGVGKRETVGVNVKQVEKVASKVKVNLGMGMKAQGTNLSKQEIKKLDGFLFLFHSRVPQEETRGCTTQHLLLDLMMLEYQEHMEDHAVAGNMFLPTTS